MLGAEVRGIGQLNEVAIEPFVLLNRGLVDGIGKAIGVIVACRKLVSLALATACWKRLREQGYTGRYAQLTKAIRRWRSDGGSRTARHALAPLILEWGEAFKSDLDERLVIGGVHRKVQLAHMKLCARLAFWRAASTSARATRCCSIRIAVALLA